MSQPDLTTAPTITIAPSMSPYFEEAIADAIRARRVQATEAASQYLVGILCSFAHPDEAAGSTFTKPLTFLLRDALEAFGMERFKRLCALGDGILYALGFFGRHIEMKGVDKTYVVGVGSAAYSHAAAMLRVKAPSASSGARDAGSGPDVLSEMTVKFDSFVEVLSDVSEGTIGSSAPDQRSVVRLYERWLRTGSSRLASALGAHGILPVRSAGGLS